MALSIHEAASIIGAKPARGFQFKSSLPFVHEDAAPAGCTWEFDYSFNWDRGDAPEVLVTHVRLMTHSGQEYPIKVADLDGRWIAEMESLISEELEASVDEDCFHD